jgi:hypothetical protein
MQSKAEAVHALAERCQAILSVLTMLEPQDNVVSVAHDDDVAASDALPPLPNPQVKDIVEITTVRLRGEQIQLVTGHVVLQCVACIEKCRV